MHDADELISALAEEESERVAGATSRAWRDRWQWVAAAVATIVLAALTYTRGGWVPILSGADLGVHEFGHMIFMWAPSLWVSFAGTFMQVATPLMFAGYFGWRRDGFATVLMFAWAAENLNNVSVYIYDATRMVLPLWGDDGSGAGHDWANILGGLGWLDHTDALAYAVRGISVVVFLVALGFAAFGFAQPLIAARKAEAEARRIAALPRREPRNPVNPG